MGKLMDPNTLTAVANALVDSAQPLLDHPDEMHSGGAVGGMLLSFAATLLIKANS
jgi:hypothetical protein